MNKADYEVGGNWGNSIEWFKLEEFTELPEPFDSDKYLFSVVGWKRKRPKVGDTLYCEMQKSHMWFEFASVDLKLDPPDMFFGKVKVIKQEAKNE